MTQKQEYLRRGLLAKIHIRPFTKQSKELDAWQEYLLNSYGVRSSADLSIDELYNLLDVMDGKTQPKISGVRPRVKRAAKLQTDKDAPLTEKQEAYLRKLWNIEPGKRGLVTATKELAEFSLRTLGFSFLYLQDLSSSQAGKLITGSEYLFGMKKRKNKKEKNKSDLA
jgi:hypothetical protein